MKKINHVILILIILTPFNFLHSQLINGYGIKGGLVLAYHTIGETSSTPYKHGCSFGIFGDFLEHGIFSLRAEMDYTQKGAKFTDVYPAYYPNYKMDAYTSINYASISTYGMIKIKPYKFINFYGFAGPRFDYLINYNESILIGRYENINKSDLGFSLGIGSEINLNKKIALIPEFRYCFDFAKFIYGEYSNGPIHRYSEESYSNKTIEFIIGIRIDNKSLK